MTYESREVGLSALQQVLVGKQIVGMYFRTANLYFAAVADNGSVLPGETYLRIENKWALVQNGEIQPPTQSTLSHTAWQELARAAIDLSPYKVTKVALGNETPNLSIHFEGKTILFVSGFDSTYESWEVSLGKFCIVATPAGKLAVWTPDNFEKADQI